MEYAGESGVSLRFSLQKAQGARLPLFLFLLADGQADICAPQHAHGVCVRAPGARLTDAAVCHAVRGLLDQLYEELDADDMRLYLLGANEGADGVWALLSMYPRLFAAAVAAGGWGDPYAVRTVRVTPVWSFFHPGDQPLTPQGGPRGLADGRLMALSLRGQGHEQVRCDAWTEGNPLSRADVQAWLLAQDRRHQLEINCIRPGLWHMEDFFRASCYLVEGPDSALLIDSGMAQVDLPAVVSRLTRLPVKLALTHAHGDHYGNAEGFDPIYMHPLDIESLPYQIERFKRFHPDSASERLDWIHRPLPVRDGDRIDLGGGVSFEVLELPGHTPGSVVFACESLGLMFTGDAMVSGEIVLLYGAREALEAVVSDYRLHLRRFIERVEGMREMTFFGGHRMQDASCALFEQERILSGGVSYYNPLCLQVARDMEALCGEILAGRCLPEESENALTFKDRRAGIVYRLGAL